MNDDERLYTPQFFQVLAAAMLTMTGVSMQFHFGEYVASIGYGVDVLGWITGIGVVGSVLLRPYAGTWIDRLGCRPCFFGSALGAAVADFAFQFTDTLWLICLIRVVMAASNATFLATIAVYAAHAAPPRRRAESLGTVGIGGFLGMMLGPTIGDAIFTARGSTAEAFGWFFTTAAAVSLLAGLVVLNVRVTAPARHTALPPVASLVRHYWPGGVLLICIAFASCLTVQMTFLERFAHARGFEEIRWFFLAYGATAISMRLFFRQVPQRFGRRRVCCTGLCVMGVGTILFIPVRAEWHLLLPALMMGMGHAFVFPSMVDLVADAMPVEHRGVGTSLALGAMDIGFLAGGVTWGQTISWWGFERTFVLVGVMTSGAALWFLLRRRRRTAVAFQTDGVFSEPRP